MYWYNWFSWWWALGCSKHVENWNKHIEKNCASCWSFTKNHNKMHDQQNIKGTLFPWRQTAHRELSPINYKYVTNNTISSSPTTIFLLGTSYYYTRVVHNNTAVRSIHQTVLLVGLKCKVSYCVNTHTMALGSTQPITEMSTRNIPQG